LIQYYSPTLHRLVAGVLYSFARPRETPLADEFVLAASRRPDPAPFTLMDRLKERKTTGLEDMDMSAECLDHMAAGIDTTGDGLCFLMWELSQPRSMHFQTRLQEELRENSGVPPDKLRFLEAVIMEGLRCFPPIPMSLPRYVPAGGRVIDGYFVPGGVVVSSQAYSVHLLNPDVFPNPERFDPTRWLDDEGDAERKRMQFAFSTGGRGCVGKQ
jgi:cytochrome P450